MPEFLYIARTEDGTRKENVISGETKQSIWFFNLGFWF